MNIQILSLLIYVCLGQPEQIKTECFERVEKEMTVYEMFNPSNHKMIPYKDWKSFHECTYNKCKESDYL